VRERRRRAHNDRYVGVSAAEDAMVHLFGSLPAADGRKLDTRLRELANTPCPADGRTFDQRKADAVGALVEGLDYLPCACGRDDCSQQTGDRATPRKPLVHVIVLGTTLEGEDEESGYLDGYGLIDAAHARNLADDADIEYVRVPDDVHYHRTQNPATDPADESPADAATGAAVAAECAGTVPGEEGRIQAVVATTGDSGSNSRRCIACAGVMPPRVLRGRSLSSAATACSRSGECTDSSVPLGKYWRSNPFDAPMFVKRRRVRRGVGLRSRFVGRGGGPVRA